MKHVGSILVCLIGLLGGLAACIPAVRQFPDQSTATEVFYIPPPQETEVPTPNATLPTSVEYPEPTPHTPTPSCYNDLRFLQDLSVLDGTVVQAGAMVDKRWQVLNSGSCDWNHQYTLRLISGDPLGLESPQALFPARSNTNAIIQLIFIAPTASGEYFSTWQAVDASGTPFGEEIFLHIVVD